MPAFGDPAGPDWVARAELAAERAAELVAEFDRDPSSVAPVVLMWVGFAGLCVQMAGLADGARRA